MGSPAPCYANSPLYQEKDLCDFADWTPEVVRQRRERILDFIWARWDVEPVVSDEHAAAELVEQLIGDEPLGTINITETFETQDAQAP